MEEQEQPQQMGIEEQQQKDNNQLDMLEENPIDEERNDPPNEQQQQQDREPLEGEQEPAEMEQEEKLNPEDANEEFEAENEAAEDEAISEEVEANQDQNQEPSQNEASLPEEASANEEQMEVQPAPPSSPPHADLPHAVEQAEQIVQVDIREEQEQQHEEGQASAPQGPSAEEVRAEQERARQLAEEARQLAEETARQESARLALIEQKKIEENLAYTNKIEILVETLSQSLARSRSDEQTLRQSNKSLSVDLANSKQVALQLRKRKMELEMQRLKLGKQLQKLRRENSDFREKLAEIEKIGDILLLQSTVEELQVLTRSQEQEIEQLKIANTQQAHNYYQEQFNLLESYQTELNSAREQNDALRVELQIVKNDRAQLQYGKQQVERENRGQLQLISVLEGDKSLLKGQLSVWEKKWESFEQQRAQFKRTRELDQRVSQYESERFMGEDNEVQLIPTLSDREEKNLLLKEYLKLEALYEESRTRQEQAELRLKRLLRDTKTQEANSIRKKDYQDLLSRYRKAKGCLEGAFARLKALERLDASPKEIRDEVEELLEGNESRLCQALIRRTSEQQQLVSDRINEMEWTDEIITLKKENAKLREGHIRLEREVKNNEKILYLMNDELDVRKRIAEEKAKVIEKLIASGCHHSSQHFQERITDLERQLRGREESLAALEIKSVLLIRENEAHLQQINHWRALYNEVKDRLAQKIALSLAESQRPVLPGRPEPEASEFCRECERRSLCEAVGAQFSSEGVQTQGNSQLHYKQIKESLLCLKRINKEVEAVPESHQRTVRLITDFRDKYEKYIEKYNAKLLELKKERAENEAWRGRARQEIREEFQEIRDIIGNNRLATALRQAKSLIDYLENEQEKGGEEEEGKEEGKEDMEEENEPEEK